MKPLHWINERHYEVPPEEKSIVQCEAHGRSHRAYGWIRQVDPRWSDEQKEAYLHGYERSTA